MLSTGQVQALGHRVPTATAPKRAPGSPPAGAAIGSHLLPVRGRMPRPLHQRWAEMGCDTRLSPEAVSAEGDTGSCPRAWPTTASNTEQAAALLRGLCGCRGQAGIGGPPRGAPSPWAGGCQMVPDLTPPPSSANNQLLQVIQTHSSHHPPHHPQLPDKHRSPEQWKPVG